MMQENFARGLSWIILLHNEVNTCAVTSCKGCKRLGGALQGDCILPYKGAHLRELLFKITSAWSMVSKKMSFCSENRLSPPGAQVQFYFSSYASKRLKTEVLPQ